jgi:hypothetical protein
MSTRRRHMDPLRAFDAKVDMKGRAIKHVTSVIDDRVGIQMSPLWEESMSRRVKRIETEKRR